MNFLGFGNWERELIDWVSRAPLLLVLALVGAVCLWRLSNRPREHWLLGSAAALLLFSQLGLPKVTSFLLNLTGGMRGGDETSRLFIQFAISLPYSLITAAAWGLLLYAAFGEGSGTRSKYLIEDEPSDREAD